MRSHSVDTDRLRMHLVESGPEDGVPVVLIHGNLSTGRFYEHLFEDAPERYRLIAPDMRGFGDTESVPIDATRGLRDWADDTAALVEALGVETPHLVGWSTGGAAIAAYAMDRPVASLTLIDPVSPYGFGGMKLDGTPHFPDFAGSGGGTGNPEFTARLAAGDRSADGDFAPRNVMNSSYWRPDHREPPEREDMLVDEMLKSVIGDDGYPGDSTASENWPGVAPGTRGILNALSPKYCNWAGIVELEPKPPILWTHGTRRHRHRRRVAVGDGDARAARVSRAGPARRRSRRSRWWPRSAPCWSAMRRRAAAWRPRCSRAPGTARRSTRASAGARGSSASWSPCDSSPGSS